MRLLRWLRIMRLVEGGSDMPSRTIGAINPGEVGVQDAERAARRIRDFLESHPDDPIEALGETGDQSALVIPRQFVIIFAQILDALAQGRGVQVMQVSAELTTQQAADMLGVSRPYLISKLEAGEIPYRKVGRHRRITLQDVMEYRRRDELQRRAAADELAGLSEELGLY